MGISPFMRIVSLFALTTGLLLPSFGADAAQTQFRAEALPNFVELANKLGPVVVNISATQAVKREQPSAQQPNPFGGGDPFNEFWRRFMTGEAANRRWFWLLALVVVLVVLWATGNLRQF